MEKIRGLFTKENLAEVALAFVGICILVVLFSVLIIFILNLVISSLVDLGISFIKKRFPDLFK